jgi:cyclopropane-fatty-acyl-phospholipid synthase
MNEQTEILGTTPAHDEGVRTPGLYRNLVIRMLSGLQYGRLTVRDGRYRWDFGSGRGPHAHITVHDPAFYRRVVWGGSIAAGEAYVDKLWDVDDLTALVRVMVGNLELRERLEKGFAWLVKPIAMLRHLLKMNSRRGTRQNILAHYDLGNDMYRTFLDSAMMYSSARYPDENASLEEAQQHKLETLCRKLDLKPSDSVIEIGSGWGGFALYAARHYGCHVTTTTISDAQYEEAVKRISEAGLTDRITLLRRDYRDLTGSYDKLVSVEMIEAVGHRYLPGYFKKCADLLKPGGTMVLQAITIADQRYGKYVGKVDFLQRHIFPGGCVPSLSRMVGLIAEKTDMVVRHIDDFGHDYARTIGEWLRRFQKSSSALEGLGYDERFRRLWEYYLCYCQGGFLERYISVVHLTATRPGRGL